MEHSIGEEERQVKELVDISAPQRAICSSAEPRNLFLAGVGSGKTHTEGLLSGYFVKKFPEIRGFIGANTYAQLTKSSLSRILNVWSDVFGWTGGVDYVVDIKPPEDFTIIGTRLKEYKNTISFKNGHLIFLSSLENYKAIDGTEFAYALLDETKDTKEEAVKEVIIARLRQIGMFVCHGKVERKEEFEEKLSSGIYKKKGDKIFNTENGHEVKGFNPLYIFTSPAKVEWLNQWFGIDERLDDINTKIFSKDDFYHSKHNGVSVTISSTYHNEKNLSLGYIENLIRSYEHNPSLIDMMIFGSPIAKTGGEWFSRFDRTVHVKDIKMNPDYPLHITLDFNVVPYITLLVCQFIPDEKTGRMNWNTLKEYCLESPMNNTESVCGEFFYDYAGMIRGLYYYGDASGKNRSTLTKDIRHNYDVVEKVLRSVLNNDSDRVLNHNPSLVKCRDFFNRGLSGGYSFDINIHPSCVELIADFDFLKEDVNGGYKKPKVKNNITGETYEKRGHCADAWRYIGLSVFQDLFNE